MFQVDLREFLEDVEFSDSTVHRHVAVSVCASAEVLYVQYAYPDGKAIPVYYRFTPSNHVSMVSTGKDSRSWYKCGDEVYVPELVRTYVDKWVEGLNST